MNMKETFFFAKFPAIETERLIVRPFTPDDASDMFSYFQDPDVAGYLLPKNHTEVAHSLDKIQEFLENYLQDIPAPWAIECKETHRVIGHVGVVRWDLEHKRAELTWGLHQDYWGQGLAIEAMRPIIEILFTKTPMYRLAALCEVVNTRSQRIAEKLGMSFEGILRGYMWRRNDFRDMKIYSLLRSEWEH